MASAEESPGSFGSSKKRVASRQISKDDDPEAEEIVAEGSTFRRAPDAVLANRRIVKVRRTPPAVAANPFASIQLVPPSVTAVSHPEVQPGTEIGVQSPEEESKEENKENSIVAPVTEVVNQPLLETAPGVVMDVVSESSIEIISNPITVKEAENSVTVDGKSGKDANLRADGAVGPSGSSSETFLQLSSAKNAFSGSFGTGFSATLSPFGSTQSTTSTGFGSFTNGASTGSSTIFGSSLFGSTGGPGAFPSLNSVFGKTNGSSTIQLFGSGAAATVPQGSGMPSTTGITLHEVPVETGEEKEKAVFAGDASLFEFLDGQWKERGKGEIKVNVPEDADRRPRLVMRSKGNLRLLLNANIFPDMKITKMDNRGVTFVCANSTGDGKIGLTTYALKMKDPQVAREFLSTVEAHKGQTSTEPSTPESSPKAVDRPLKIPEETPKDLEAAQ